ncbi:MAG TPA: acyl-CoA thioesterase [Pyrinomonadaceae bacterium]|nr:acyl-CoA thioesterase [Pyrinomonadaceae bacterium]
MAEVFERKFTIGWRDVDPNGHVANMVYLDFAVDTRIAFFDANGFPPSSFVSQGFGPVIKTDVIDYFREVMMLETITVTMENGGFAEDGSRFRVINCVYKANGELAVRVASVGGWLNLRERRLMEPPEAVKNAWSTLARSDDFEVLGSSLRK